MLRPARRRRTLFDRPRLNQALALDQQSLVNPVGLSGRLDEEQAPDASMQSDSLSKDDRRILELNARSMIAAMVGWTICSLFASVAFNWTF